MNSKDTPTGVKIISFLIYIISALIVVFGLLAIISPITFSQIYGKLIGIGGMSVTGGFSYVIGLFYIIIGIIGIFIGKGLWKGKKWSRTFAIIISAINFAFTLLSLVGGNLTLITIINLIVSGLITGYLLFSKEVKSIFA